MAFGVCTFLIRICFAGHVPNISENHDERKAAENQCICCPFSWLDRRYRHASLP
jgi:hypothetical protein